MSLDFVEIGAQKNKKSGATVIYPEFIVCDSTDLMVRGHGFYAVWNEGTNLWIKEEKTVKTFIDNDLQASLKNFPKDEPITVQWMKKYSTKKWSEWQAYVKSLPDSYHELDENVTFQNSEVKKEDYVSKKLPYSIKEGDIENYNRIIGTLYSPENRQKIEWAIGAIIKGDSKKIQKFLVLYGEAGTGKSTILNIIQKLFEGYYAVFDAKSLASANNLFALEAFKSNPLVAIQHDGDLSRIEDNTKLNSLVSHEYMLVNEKFKTSYQSKFNAFLFMGTNRPVKITDARSGILRRLIDVSPSGNTLPVDEYDECYSKIDFELGAIAYHCLRVYEELGENYYKHYRPQRMMGATNDFFNFLDEMYDTLIENEEYGISLQTLWERYKSWVTDANVPRSYSMMVFKEELRSYFKEFHRTYEGRKDVYRILKRDKFEEETIMPETEKSEVSEEVKEPSESSWLTFDQHTSILDDLFSECPAQYAPETTTEKMLRWVNVKTKLKDLDTTRTHYLKKNDEHYITMDFDMKDETGEKSLELNIEAASKFPKTYAELSNSGKGIHLEYYYPGDVNELARKAGEDIEIKVFPNDKGSTLRRRVCGCNNLPIATITSGLPLKKKGDTVPYSTEGFENEQHLLAVIRKGLRKEVHDDTRSSIDFINQMLNKAYESGMSYDVHKMRQPILLFAMQASNQSDYCTKLVSNMHFMSKDYEEKIRKAEIANEYGDEKFDDEAVITFFDLEVFKNLLVICYKLITDDVIYTLINPTAEQCQNLANKKHFKLVGFNNRKYDNHILYARMQGYSLREIYNISQKIINGEDGAFFSNAYNLSYTDIYDFSSKKQSLKKFEIDLGIHHQELGLPWDQEVPKELWRKVAEYCSNDVAATEATWYARSEDWSCRQMLSEISGLSVNATNNNHSEEIVFGDNRNPQSQFIYTDLSKEFPGYQFDERGLPDDVYIKNEKGKPIKTSGKSVYMGEDPSEGGYAWSKPGMYGNVALLDIASMHPTTMIVLKIFGEKYTARVADLKNLRILVKHKQYDEAGKLFDGKLAKYLESPETAKALAGALKIVINAIYGLTAAHFPNRFRDPRNVDNIVAKRGALFMIKLKNEVISRGYTVVHCKTDSIKIADATREIIDFVMNFGKQYGYDFEHEATYDKMCIVNKACYIARYRNADGSLGDWTATAEQFQIPYVFKSLFSHEKIVFDDVCETKSVKSAIYLDMNEKLPHLSPDEEKLYLKLKKIDLDTGKLKKNGTISRALTQEEQITYHNLEVKEKKGHNYIFVGRVGNFCPIKPGYGGGELLRDQDGKMNSVEGAKGYRWLESEPLRASLTDTVNIPVQIDRSYYEKLVDEAVDAISKYGDFEWFTSEDPYRGEFLEDHEEPFIDPLEGMMNMPTGEVA